MSCFSLRVDTVLQQPDQMGTDVGFVAAAALCLLSSIMSSARMPAGSGSLGKYTSSYENTMAQLSNLGDYANMTLPLSKKKKKQTRR